MPPRAKFTRGEIVQAALAIVRRRGPQALTARALGAELGSSSRPVFTVFCSMEEVQREVIEAADAAYQGYLKEDMARGEYPAYKASGMGYIRFAKEEPELFKLLFMRDRTGEEPKEGKELGVVVALIQKSTGLDEESARRFHLEMWIFVHGIATMIATRYLKWEMDFVSQVLTDAYTGLKCRYLGKEKKDGGH